MIALKILTLLLFSSCQNSQYKVYNSFEDLFKKINTQQVEIENVSERLTPIYFEGGSSDTTLFIEPSLPDLKFLKIEQGNVSEDIIKINDIPFVLQTKYKGKEIKFDTDLLNAEVYKLVLNEDSLICIVSKGSGLLKSGTFQEITFFSLINISDISVSSFVSRSNSIYAFNDIDLDGDLDFLMIEGVDKDNEIAHYKMSEYSFNKDIIKKKNQSKYTKFYIEKNNKGEVYFIDALH